MADLEAGRHGLDEPFLNQAPAGASVAATGTVYETSIPGEHWTRSVARKFTVGIQNIGTSLFFGLVTAFGLKTVGQSVAIALVLLFIGFQVLAYYGFVNFNWTSVGGAVARRLDFNKDGHLNLFDLGIALRRLGLFILSWGIPSVVGFTLGFWLGWKVL